MEWSDETTPRGLDLPRLFGAVRTHKRWVILPTCAAFLCAVGIIVFVKPKYTATAKVMLENGESYYTRPEKAVGDNGVVIDDLVVLSEAEAAKTPEVERRAMAKLKPEDLEEFSGASLFSLFASGPDDAELRRLEAFNRKLDIYPQAKTKVLLFEFTSRDRARAARISNALAESYLELQQVTKDTGAKTASKWLSQQIDELRARVATAEARVEDLRSKSGLLTGVNGIAVPTQQLSEIATQIATARAAEAAATSKANSLREMARTGRLDEVAAIANDDSLRRYADSRVALKAQMAELGRTLLPGHPRMKELAGQLAGLEVEIRTAAMKRARSFEEEAHIAGAQLKSLQQAVSTQAHAVTSNDADTVKLRELEIDAKTARDQLESYLTKYREAMARDGVDASPANGRIIARALAPIEPSFPKPGPLLLLAPLAGFFVSLGLVIAKILLTDGAPAASAAVSARPAPPTRRETKLPFGIDPPMGPPAQDESEEEAPSWIEPVERFADRLAATAEGENLSLMVAGEAGALPAALAAARRLTRHGRTALLDLGPSPAWLSDLFDPQDSDGPAHRDLSTALEIYPSRAAVGAEDVGDLVRALARDYDFVVVHAQDWRSRAAREATEELAALLLVAPSSEIGAVEARARAAYREAGLAIKAIASGARLERAA